MKNSVWTQSAAMDNMDAVLMWPTWPSSLSGRSQLGVTERGLKILLVIYMGFQWLCITGVQTQKKMKIVLLILFYSWHHKNKTLLYIRMYWTNFWQPTVREEQQIFEKLLYRLVAQIFTLLLAPFVSKLVKYSRKGESLKNVGKW